MHPGGVVAANRRKLILVGRIVVSVALLAVLIAKIGTNWSDALPPLTFSAVAWLLAAFALAFAGLVLAAVRWGAVLRALGQPVPLRRLVSIYLAGQFVGNVLPSTIGGDALRVARLGKDTGESPIAFASVVLDRLTGWLILPVLTLIGLGVNPGLRHLGHASTAAFGVASITLALLIVVLALTMGRIRNFEATLEQKNEGWRRFTSAVRFGMQRLAHQPAAVAEVLGAGFAYQLVILASILMAARGLQMPAAVGFTALLAFVPTVLIAQVLPISIAGLGVREGLFAVFLHPLGVPRSKALALGLIVYLLNLLVSLLGAPSFAVGHRRRSSTPTPVA